MSLPFENREVGPEQHDHDGHGISSDSSQVGVFSCDGFSSPEDQNRAVDSGDDNQTDCPMLKYCKLCAHSHSSRNPSILSQCLQLITEPLVMFVFGVIFTVFVVTQLFN